MVTTTIILLVVLIAFFPATQYLRNIVHDRRARETGVAGTQDIVIWATFISFLLMLATAVCFYFAVSSLRERLGQ